MLPFRRAFRRSRATTRFGVPETVTPFQDVSARVAAQPSEAPFSVVAVLASVDLIFNSVSQSAASWGLAEREPPRVVAVQAPAPPGSVVVVVVRVAMVARVVAVVGVVGVSGVV